MIVPVGTFFATPAAGAVNFVCIVVGIAAALALDRFNQSIPCRTTETPPLKNLQPEKALPGRGRAFCFLVIRFWGSAVRRELVEGDEQLGKAEAHRHHRGHRHDKIKGGEGVGNQVGQRVHTGAVLKPDGGLRRAEELFFVRAAGQAP